MNQDLVMATASVDLTLVLAIFGVMSVFAAFGIFMILALNAIGVISLGNRKLYEAKIELEYEKKKRQDLVDEHNMNIINDLVAENEQLRHSVQGLNCDIHVVETIADQEWRRANRNYAVAQIAINQNAIRANANRRSLYSDRNGYDSYMF